VSIGSGCRAFADADTMIEGERCKVAAGGEGGACGGAGVGAGGETGGGAETVS